MARTRNYLIGEAALILAWAYVLLVGGGITAQINFRVQVANAALAALVLGGWLVWRLIRGQSIPWSGIDAAIVLFLGALALATVYSTDPRRSLAALSMYLVWAMAFYLWWDCLRAGAPAELLEKTLLIVGGIIIVFGLLDAAASLLAWRNLTLAGQLPFAPPFVYRLYSWLGDANLGAAVVNLLIPPALMRGLRSRGAARVGWWAYALLALAFVYFTSSRGGWLGTAAGLGVLGLLLVRDSRRAGQTASPGLQWLARISEALGWLRQRPVVAVVAAALVLALVVGGGVLLVRQAGSPTHGPVLLARSAFWSSAWRAFLVRPLTGNGLGTYATVFTQYGGVPPERPYLHAHSFPITLLAEAGLNGFVGLIVLIAGIGAGFSRIRQPVQFGAAKGKPTYPPPLLDVAGPLAALAGLAVHSLFDNHLPFGAVAIPSACYVAMVFHGAAAPPPKRAGTEQANAARRPVPGISPWLFLAVGLPVAGLALYSFRAQAVFERGLVASGAGAWPEAAARFDEASARDPSFALYRLQAGYVYGLLAAQGDSAALATAIDRYEAGLRLEPDYSLNHANLGALYLQAGRPADARVEFRRAVNLAGEPGSWLFWLNYGAAAEAEGDDLDAQDAYQSALDLRASLAGSAYWQANDLRRGALAAWQARREPPSGPLQLGWAALEHGDEPAAQTAFEAAWQADPQSPSVYHGLALAAEARGDDNLAQAYLDVALSLQLVENEPRVLPLLDAAELAARAGQTEQARQNYEAVFGAISEATAYGWGGRGFSPYAWFVFARESLPVDLLPQLVRADVPAAVAERLLPLGDLREAAGDPAGAAALYRRLLEFDPGLTEAEERLKTLEGASQ